MGAAGNAHSDDRLTAAGTVLIGVAAFFPSGNLVDELLQFVQVGVVGAGLNAAHFHAAD